MSTIFFMAVQCCQCSTMQVKQKKKNSNSNKWTCVVCNQKQSIRKVFAQGPMAKDLRLYVQSFNMSRQFENNSSSFDAPPLEEDLLLENLSPADHKRRRTDWTEFLDPDHQISEDVEQEVKPERGFEPEIVTELPVGLFKKAKLNRNIVGGECAELYKPVFSKRNSSKQVLSQDNGPRNFQDLTNAEDDSEWGHCKTREDDQKSRKRPLKKGREDSKWSDYITEDEDNRNNGVDDQASELGNTIFRTLMDEEKIEDDEIHPDFL